VGGMFTQVKETKQKKYSWVKILKEEEEEEEIKEQGEDEYVYEEVVIEVGDTFEIHSDTKSEREFGKLILAGKVEEITEIDGGMKYKLLIQPPYDEQENTTHTVRVFSMCKRKWKMYLLA
jgi:hypothetical protein